jgi:phosphoglycolate phosphatase-like HAD superfamily hydrolase
MAIEIPTAAPKALRDLGGKRDRLRQAAREATAELHKLELRLEAASAEDRQAFADRLARDVSASNPGGKAAAKVRQTIDEVKARKQALLVAVENAEREIATALGEHGRKWLAAAEGEQEKRRRRYEETVGALGVARKELDGQEVLVRWLRRPEIPLGKLSRPRPLSATSLKLQNGNLQTFEVVLAALRDDCQPAKPNAPRTLEVVGDAA